MSTVVLFQATNPKIGALELDATMTETHSGDVEVTEHPVEKGANIADHFRVKPAQLVLEGMVSNTPVPKKERESMGEALRGTGGRAQLAYEALLAMRESDELITIATRLRSYENMKLTALSVPRDRNTGDALRFSATFREIVLVSSETVDVPKTSRGKGKNNSGHDQPKPQPEEQARSLAKGIKDGISDLLAGKTDQSSTTITPKKAGGLMGKIGFMPRTLR